MTRSREKFVVVRGGSGEWLRCRLVVVRGDTSAAFAVGSAGVRGKHRGLFGGVGSWWCAVKSCPLGQMYSVQS